MSRTRVHRWTVVLAAMIAGSSAVGSCFAGEALYLNWEQCGPAGAANEVFSCDNNSTAFPLFCAFSLAQPLTDVIGLELVVDLQHADSTLPDWWQLGVGGCRYGQLSANGAAPTGADCLDLWQGDAVGGIQGYEVGQPRGQPNQARIKVALSVLPTSPRSLNADVLYHAATIVLGGALTAGVPMCTGCSGSACLVLNSILIRRLPGAIGGDVTLTLPGPGNGNFATWENNGGGLCGAVPVRRTTWGQIKALYR